MEANKQVLCAVHPADQLYHMNLLIIFFQPLVTKRSIAEKPKKMAKRLVLLKTS